MLLKTVIQSFYSKVINLQLSPGEKEIPFCRNRFQSKSHHITLNYGYEPKPMRSSLFMCNGLRELKQHPARRTTTKTPPVLNSKPVP